MYLWFTRTESGRLEVAKHPDAQELSQMNCHKHARLTYARRIEMVREMVVEGVSVPLAPALRADR